jgi:hypothetical protein
LKLSAFPKPQGLNKLLWFALLQLAVIFGLIWIIAGNDRLFRNTVPIEQRLVSHNESIREKAQQELLGLEPESKKKVVTRLIPAMEQDDPVVRKWAAISFALIGPSAQEAIPVLLQSVSAKEKGVAQASRYRTLRIGGVNRENGARSRNSHSSFDEYHRTARRKSGLF